MKKTILFLFLFLSIGCFAQFSKTHYIPPLSNSDSQEPQGQYMYISCPSLKAVNFKIIQIGSTTIKGTVSRDLPYVLNIGTGFNTQLLVNASDVSKIKKNKGYIIEAEDLVYVTVRLTSTPQNYQAGGLVSKGLAALGTQFRIGAFTNTSVESTTDNHYTFASILATENNTKIAFSDLKPGISILNNASAGNSPSDIILNTGESYVIAVQGPNNANRDGMIGALITSDKPVAVNCGSFAGSNGDLSNLDLGFDQIVSAERTGKEYIFIKGGGSDIIERPLIVANEDNTIVYLNGSSFPFTTLDSGEYLALDGSHFSNERNLYVQTSKNAFAYQSIGGTDSQANQNMHFVPPLSCETPKIINNIPFINKVGNTTDFVGTVCIVTEKNATLNFIINGISHTLYTLPSSITFNGPLAVTGNSGYETYTFEGLSGNISVLSTNSVYLSYYGSSGASTYGGFYSGFIFKPQITFEKINVTQSSCIPNTKLSVSEILGFDTYQWFFNKEAISNANSNSYYPTKPGYYYVSAAISTCGTTFISDEIPVSDCPSNMGNDVTIDNMDVDNDKDGITNCTESYGNLSINTSNFAAGSIQIGNYSNSFTGTVITSGTSPAVVNPFVGKSNGDFITEVPSGKGNSITYEMHFDQPLSIALEYISTAAVGDLINSNADFIVKSPFNTTITVMNPNNQLLIDTNYDGIFESGITEYSSFEIRFRVNSTVPLAAGTGTFSFRSYLTNSFTFIQKNTSDTQANKATFALFTTCVPLDSDGDEIADQLDLDSDNDGVPDTIEAQNPYKPKTNIDSDADGLDDIYEFGLTPIDSDNDGIANYLDLDSDNNGIYDLIESGSQAPDNNSNGIIDGTPVSFGQNGLYNTIETTLNSGILNYTIEDTDGDTINNTIEIDNDNDSCSDVIEAGFTDGNMDSFLGNTIAIVNTNGVITNAADGYTNPGSNYILSAPILITSQPENRIECEFQNTEFTIVTNPLDSYQWEVSDDGINWNVIIDNATYSGATTNTLIINKVKNTMNGFKYRVVLSKTGNSCGLFSEPADLTVYPVPIVSDVTIIQCDDDLDAMTAFNLTVKNDAISANYTNETFTYYNSLAGAETKNSADLISNPLSFINLKPSAMIVWSRVENNNTNCFSVAQLNLKVEATNISASNFVRSFSVCDDFIDASENDEDGISTFNFSSVTNEIQSLLPVSNVIYSIKYYRNQADALEETNAITNTSNYRNIGYPNTQQIWGRIDSELENSCFGIGPYITLTVEKLPNIDTNEDHIEDELVCSNLPNFFVTLNAGITDGSSTSNYTYSWKKDGILITNANASILAVNTIGIYTVEVKTTSGCSRTRTINVTASDAAYIESVIVDDLTAVNTITVNVTGQGDYEYSLDSPYGPFQNSNFFDTVSTGIHEIFINDKNQCGTTSKTIAVVGMPKYFTPNNDGFNDYWNMKGANTNLNKNAIIYIFDRYGKLLLQIDPSGRGWDGTLNGVLLPADDYWYTVKLEDGRETKGHFSLKR